MKSLWLAGCLALVQFIWSVGVLAAGDPRPNFLFLFADDQRADTLSAYGNSHIRTPTLDKLVADGFSFRGNYCFGGDSGAVCIPSRAMLMSGRTWFRVRHDLRGVKLMPEVFREAGYETFATGKWHNGRESFARAFEHGRSVFFGGMSDHTKIAVCDLRADGGFTETRRAAHYSTEEFAGTAVDFLEHFSGDRPFFAYVAFTVPHDPRDPPPAWREEYEKNLPPLPRNFLPQHPFDNGQLVLRDENLAPWPRPPQMIREQLAAYYALIGHLDSQVGRILAALAQSRFATNTYIVYAADHGLAIGSHGLLGKQSVYEHSMRCPLILVGPGIPAGKSSPAFTYLLDLFPTLAHMAGLPVPEGVDGKDLSGIWTGRVARVRDTVFLPYMDLMRAVRDERWKLICYPKVNHVQLFDLRRDPDERRDLAEDRRHAATRQRLMELLAMQQREYGDTAPLRSEHPAPLRRDLTGLRRKPDEWQPEWIRRRYFSE